MNSIAKVILTPFGMFIAATIIALPIKLIAKNYMIKLQSAITTFSILWILYGIFIMLNPLNLNATLATIGFGLGSIIFLISDFNNNFVRE